MSESTVNAILIAIGALLAVLVLRLLWKAFRRRPATTTEDATTADAAPTATVVRPTPSSTTRSAARREPVTGALDLDGGLGFGHRDEAANTLPRVEAHEVPGVNTGDMVFGGMTPTLAELLPDSPERREQSRIELRSAGYYGPHAWHNLAAVRYVGIIVTLLGVASLLLFVPEEFEVPVLIALLVLPPLAWAFPRLVVRGRAADRVSEIERGMPDMLDMLNMCTSQGMTVWQGIERVAREIRPAYPALAEELAIVVEQGKLGTWQHALENFAARIDVPEVQSFVSLLVQTDRMGTSVSAALVEYSDGMRESLRQRADTKANQAAFKLLFPTVLCLMPAVYLFLLGPALIELSEFLQRGGLDVLDTGTPALRQFQQP